MAQRLAEAGAGTRTGHEGLGLAPTNGGRSGKGAALKTGRVLQLGGGVRGSGSPSGLRPSLNPGLKALGVVIQRGGGGGGEFHCKFTLMAAIY